MNLKYYGEWLKSNVDLFWKFQVILNKFRRRVQRCFEFIMIRN